MVLSVKSHLRQPLPHEKQRTYTFCAAASLDENTPECLSLFTLWDLRHLLACWRSKTLASTSRWICSCDFVLPQCLNETSLSCWAFSCLVWFLDFIKQMTTASNKRTAGPVLGSGLQEGGGECILWCLSGRALAHSSDWGVRMLPEAMQGSSVLLLLLSYVSLAALKYFYLWKILLIYFCLIFPVDCQLVVEAESVIISV